MKLYSVTQTAEKLHVSRQYVWFLIKTGRLDAQLVGNQYIIPEEVINDYLTYRRNK